MENTTDNQFAAPAAPVRPQFLKVLCILTWICCGFMFISAILGIVGQSPEKQQEKIDQMREINPETADQMEVVLNAESQSEKMISAVINLIGVLLSAYGAIMMWQLKKTGFYIYIIGELVPYAGFAMGGAQAMAAVGAMAGGMGAAIAGIAVGIMLIFDIAFIIMYGVNLKYMKK
jgi:uncharacterized BrkB/YihY/UPF0761 family membrane protein